MDDVSSVVLTGVHSDTQYSIRTSMLLSLAWLITPWLFELHMEEGTRPICGNVDHRKDELKPTG